MAISAFLANRLTRIGTPARLQTGFSWLVELTLRIHQVAAVLLLLLLSPLMLGIALWICVTDGMPVLYGHFRIGQDGRVFRCLKFRTMCRDSERVLQQLLADDPAARAEWDRDQKLEDDPRVTPIGRLLRLTSLDELPQLLNVLRGEMLLVGPRPVTAAELERYGESRWHYLSVRPGITGLWQVSGRNRLSYEQRVALDRQYVDRGDWWLDLRILARTVAVVVLRDGAK